MEKAEEMNLKLCQKPMMELFCKNNQRLKGVNYFLYQCNLRPRHLKTVLTNIPSNDYAIRENS